MFKHWVLKYTKKNGEIGYASLRTYPPINRDYAIEHAKPYVRNNLILAYAIGENR